MLINCDSVTEKAKCGKMRQATDINGSQMAVKNGVFYCRRVMGMKRGKRVLPFNFLAAMRTMLIIGHMQPLSAMRTFAIHAPDECGSSSDGKADIAYDRTL